MTLTFVDSGVLIAAFRARSDTGRRAFAALNDPSREFACSSYVQLEVLPKALYYRQRDEVDFYNAFFARVVVWASPIEAVIARAHQEAASCGLNGMDALHVAAAIIAGVDEFVTTERPGTPIHRVTGVRVVTIHG